MAKGLDTYRAKRDFKKTREPSGVDGRLTATSDHLRFVIHKHDATRLHYDLRLELGGVFKSWAVTRGPSLDPGEKRLAVEVEDHPLEYGDFEGTIPEGEYGGGTVMVWDRGFWAPETNTPPEHSLRDGELKFIIAGSKLLGSWMLVRLKGKANEKRTNWLLIKHRDQWATPGIDEVLGQDRSVASGRTMAEIARGKGALPQPFVTTGGPTSADAVWDARATERSQRRTRAALAASAPSTTATMPKLSNPDRILWPEDGGGISKRRLAEFLVAVAPWMIAHMYGRPCSVLRAPEGITGETFFQRHAMPGQAHQIKTVTVDREHEPYLQIDEAQTLVLMAQLSVLEFHPWNCAPYQPHIPGRLVFDLDPAPDVPFAAVIDAANELRARLAKLGLMAYCKTTGGKGLHVVTPLTPDDAMQWPQAKLFAQTICAQMSNDSPRLYVIKMTKTLRTGKIYLDYLRNDFAATAVAPLSPRARPGATVSMPLTWPQVNRRLDPRCFTIDSVPVLLAKSKPWDDYAKGARPLKEAIFRLVGGAS
jgi:bifunctional non-homologous end joining protein LigD